MKPFGTFEQLMELLEDDGTRFDPLARKWRDADGDEILVHVRGVLAESPYELKELVEEE